MLTMMTLTMDDKDDNDGDTITTKMTMALTAMITTTMTTTMRDDNDDDIFYSEATDASVSTTSSVNPNIRLTHYCCTDWAGGRSA